MHDHTTYQVVRPGWGIGPRAALDAAVAHRAILVQKIEASTALRVQLPGLVTVVHHLIAHRNGFAGTVLTAYFAVLAEVLQAEVNGFVWDYRHIGKDGGGFKTRSKVWVQDNP